METRTPFVVEEYVMRNQRLETQVVTITLEDITVRKRAVIMGETICVGLHVRGYCGPTQFMFIKGDFDSVDQQIRNALAGSSNSITDGINPLSTGA